ncbi:MAG: CRP-like cAMP-binding protein, partial [Chlamydiales bacterium]
MKSKTEWISDVLIIENDEKRRNNLERAFQTFEIPSIQTSSDYLQIDPKNKHSLIIVGDNFPKTTVNEIIDHLSSKGLPKTTPLILSTTSTDPAYIRSMISAGITSIIGNTSNIDLIKKALDFCRRSDPFSKLKTLLDKLTFFSELDDVEKEQLLSVTVLRKFQAGEEIFAKGDAADVFYVLIKGKVMAILRRDDHHMNEIQINVGTPFGEMAILDKSPRSAWCIAADDSLVLEIGSHIFEDSNFLIRHKLFARLAIILAQRIRNMNNSLSKNQESNKSKAHPLQEKKPEKQKAPPPPPTPPKKVEKKAPQVQEKKGEEKEEGEEEETSEGKANPFLSPTGIAQNYSKTINTQEKY